MRFSARRFLLDYDKVDLMVRRPKKTKQAMRDDDAITRPPFEVELIDKERAIVDEVARGIQTAWGYHRLEILTESELLEKFTRQRKSYNEAIYKGTLDQVRKQSAAMIRGWRALDAAAKEAGHETLPDNYIESEPIDDTIYAFTTGDAANAKALQKGRQHQIVTYSAQEAALIIHKWPQLRQVEHVKQMFSGASVKEVRVKEKELNDSIPF